MVRVLPCLRRYGTYTAAGLKALCLVLVALPSPLQAPPVPIPEPNPAPKADPSFWSYQPLQRSALPSVRNLAWPKNTVDRFVLASLERHLIEPAPDADRGALLRRVSFDLTGLPPTLAELDGFLQDTRPDAFERVVDRLLASPHFGERWGRHWLDLARFAESVTLRGFVFKEAWRYRDYVIDALNQDRPFDQFLREQIAGDLLPATTLEERQRHRIATTFLALGNTNLEEQDKKQLDMDVVDELLDVIGRAVLAQTIACARCHDHKFDPIPTRDYYAMAGILRGARLLQHANVSAWIEVPLPVSEPEEARFQKAETQLAVLTNRLQAAKTELAQLKEPAETHADPSQPAVLDPRDLEGVVVDDSQARAVGSWKESQYTRRYIGSGYLHDLNEAKGAKTLTFHPELPRPGRYEVRFAYTPGDNRAPRVPVTVFSADGETTLEINQRKAPPGGDRFASLGQFRFESNNQGYVIVANDGTSGHVTADAVQFLPLDHPQETRATTPTANGARPPRPNDSLPHSNAVTVRRESLSQLIKTIENELDQHRKLAPKRPMVMSVRDEPAGDLPIHLRGSVHTLGDLAPRGFLSAASPRPAPPIPAHESGRRQLADWLASSENPLTARVFVNRVWLRLFGQGLVRSPDNFGSTGQRPSHPELLDHLALQFIGNGWSVKRLVRCLVLSRTYQLITPSPNTAATADPENQWFGYATRRRLDAESLRDAMLAVSGQLRLAMGGPTLPGNLQSDYGFQFQEPRRSVYMPVLRNALPDIFQVLDFADPSVPTGQRHVSTVAPQALFFLNHPFVHSQARAAATTFLAASSEDFDQRIVRANRLALGRDPTARELARTRAFFNPVSQSHSPLPLEEAWTRYFQALFGSLDFRYLD